MVANGAAERGGVQVGDKVVGLNNSPLALGQKLAELLPKGGYRAKVSLHILRDAPFGGASSHAASESSSGRKRHRPECEGMTTLDNVRIGDIGRSHIQRMVGESEQRTERSL